LTVEKNHILIKKNCTSKLNIYSLFSFLWFIVAHLDPDSHSNTNLDQAVKNHCVSGSKHSHITKVYVWYRKNLNL
jgi:hypothetical protein